MKMGMDIAAKRKCPCPLWGQFFICKIKNGGLDNEMGMSIGAKRKCPCPPLGAGFYL